MDMVPGGRARGRAILTLLAVALAATLAAPSWAQTVTADPTVVSFIPSADHDSVLADGRPAVDHYSFDIYSVGAAQPFQRTNIGKPDPGADGLVHYDFSASVAGWPLPGGNYEARVVAVGPEGSGTSTPSNPFTFSSACSYALSGTSASLPAAGGGTQVSVTTAAGCAWTATSSVAWVTLSSKGGSGSATVVATVAANTSTSSRTGTLTVAGKAFTISQAAASSSGTTASSWQHQDIGAVGLAGSVSGSGSAFTVTGSGADIWGAADSFQFLSQAESGNVEIVARMTGEQNTNQYAKAGVMLRESLTAGSAHVLLDARPGGAIEFMKRASAGGSTAYLGGSTQAAPSWLRLARVGSTVSAAVSADGASWRAVGSTTVTMGTSLYVGLAVTSHNTSLRNSAGFDHVSVTPLGSNGLPVGWNSQDIGTVGLAGSASYMAGRFTTAGAGADIWGTTDSFRYTSTALSGDGQLVARVSGIQNTNAYAKAGLMLRSGLTAGAAHVLLDVRPNGSIEFMTRSVSGGTTTYLAGTTQAVPAWLRLVRAGSTVTASVSSDGTTWRTVGSTSVSFTGGYIGMAVTSHSTTQRNTSTFDNLAVR